MDSKKTGLFLKELRKEKNITQEQLAEQFSVSNRTVSRWENGINMPDLSVLVELAEFYHVEIKEIIDGERKSEEMNEEIKEVAFKMADYAEEQKSKLLIWIRRISLIGVIMMAIVLGLQSFGYEPGVPAFLCYVCSVAVFFIMAILALYANGLLEKIVKKKNFVKGCKVFVIVAIGMVLSFVIKFVIVLVPILLWEENAQFVTQTGIENYDKLKIEAEFGGDIDSELFLFPDDTTNMLEPTFASGFKSTFFDTEGYLILQGKYSEEDYEAEVQRLAAVECTVQDITMAVQYDEESHAFPAYVAMDGYDSEYEYALIDKENCEITYVFLSYPDFIDLQGYEKYLKLDKTEYEIEDTLKQFTIYARYVEDGFYIEYSDEKQHKK